jgi:hypothetical protein
VRAARNVTALELGGDLGALLDQPKESLFAGCD